MWAIIRVSCKSWKGTGTAGRVSAGLPAVRGGTGRLWPHLGCCLACMAQLIWCATRLSCSSHDLDEDLLAGFFWAAARWTAA